MTMNTDVQANAVATIDEASDSDMLSFESLLEAYDYDMPRRGEILKGLILEVTNDQIILDVGTKHDAIVPRKDLERLEDELLDRLQPGAEMAVYVLRPLTADGELLVSINKALTMEDWDRAIELEASDEMIEVEVVGFNKGGVLVEFGRLRGFVPNSQLVEVPRGISNEQQNKIKGDLVGTMLPVKIIEVNQRRNRLVLSETAARRTLRADLLEDLEIGSVVKGRVVNIVDYGAFVDIGGLNGLIHVSKLDWQHVEHPSEVLSVGDEVEVRIDNVDVERERISLNRQACIPDPWESIHNEYQSNDLVTGIISSVADFGVFVDLPSGITGLVHISEMESYNISNPREWAVEGEELLVRIISIDADRQRIGLSLDRVTQAEFNDWMTSRDASYQPIEEEEFDEAEDEEMELDTETVAEFEAEASADVSDEVAEEVEDALEVEASPVAEVAVEEAVAEAEAAVEAAESSEE